jgi:predicted O-methyltransferase YrrM
VSTSEPYIPSSIQHQAELVALLALYEQRQPKRVLEIGTYEGGTLYQWLQGTPDVVVTVDSRSMGGKDNRSLYPTWAQPGTRLEVVNGRSGDESTFTAVEALAPFDWVFIDADHAYGAVASDWNLYQPLCSGVVAFHDILGPSKDHPEIEVYRLWGEIKAAGYQTQEFIEDRAAPWGGIGVVFLDQERNAA